MNDWWMFILGAAFVAALALIWLEGRRPNRRHRALRVLASVVAVGALAALGIFRGGPETTSTGETTQAILWTASEYPGPADIPPRPLFALPDAKHKPADAVVVPDVAFIFREYPAIKTLTIRGDGMEAFDLYALRNVKVEFEPPVAPPSIRFLDLPRELVLGDRLIVRGIVEGSPSGEPATLTLSAPDRTTTETTLSGDEGEFEISAPSPPAEGRFLWRLKMTTGGAVLLDEQIGVAVVVPVLPRVLIIESSPRFETAHLQRWLGELGGVFHSRTRVGQERYRFAASAGAAQEFERIDERLLENVDVAVMDLHALTELSPDEQQVLRSAIKERGLGLLILPGGEASWPTALEDLLPWKLKAEADRRKARLQWGEVPAAVETEVAVEEFSATEVGETLVRDSQRRSLVCAIRQGRGAVALSLVRETWRWRLEDQTATFARYWSFLLSRLAEGRERDTPKWEIANAANSPLVINQPVELRYVGTAETPAPGQVSAAGEQESVVLPLAQDVAEPKQWGGTFWPRRAGWHRVAAAGGGARLDFFVHETEEWKSLRAQRRRMVTERFATLWEERISAPAAKEVRQPGRAWTYLLFGLFLVSSGFLWVERRTANRTR